MYPRCVPKVKDGRQGVQPVCFADTHRNCSTPRHAFHWQNVKCVFQHGEIAAKKPWDGVVLQNPLVDLSMMQIMLPRLCFAIKHSWRPKSCHITLFHSIVWKQARGKKSQGKSTSE